MLVSAALSSRGAPWELVRLWHEGVFELVVSHELLFELQSVLSREKFRKYRTYEESLEYVQWFREGATLADEGGSIVQAVSRDPQDDYLIALARASGADLLVSGDADLLDLEGENLPTVMSPRQFRDQLPGS